MEQSPIKQDAKLPFTILLPVQSFNLNVTFCTTSHLTGRVSSTGFIPTEPRVSSNRDTVSSSSVAVPPEEVLFRRRGAPIRYAENDIYWADRHLTEKQGLPDSDLLKAIHTYASDFYGRATKDRGAVDFESFDETALLGLGILLEEMAGHVLGETGDLAFVEGEEVVEMGDGADLRDSRLVADGDTTEATSGSGEPRKRKRRKIKHNEGATR